MPNTSASHWDALFSEPGFFYGLEPGSIARRAEKYHRPFRSSTSTALDQGCGEGQDLAFLASCGYEATGLDFSSQARRKAQELLEQRTLRAQVLAADLAAWQPTQTFDLVLSINALPFVGERADFALAQVLRAVAPRGVLGLSVWAREDAQASGLQEGVRLWTRGEILAALGESGVWQKLEVALLRQYFRAEDGAVCEEARLFVTVVAQRLK